MVPKFLKHLERPFSFAVVSDTHFVTRDFVGQAFDETRPLNAEGYAENVTYSLAPMMDAKDALLIMDYAERMPFVPWQPPSRGE